MGLEGHAEDPILDFALQNIIKNAAAGVSVLSSRLDLREPTRELISKLIASVDAFYALSLKVRQRRKEPHALLINELYDALKVELELVYGDGPLSAFQISYDILQTQIFFRATTGDGSSFTHRQLTAFLYTAQIHEMVRIGLSNLLMFCESQERPPLPLVDVRRFATGFGDRTLSDSQVGVLRSNLMGPWVNALDRHFTRIQLYVPDGTTVSPRDVCVYCLEIGRVCGRLKVLTELAADNVSQANSDLQRLEFLLQRLKIPFNTDEVKRRLKGHRKQARTIMPDGISARVEYDYAVASRLVETVDCLLGSVPKTLVATGVALGSIVPLVWFGADSGDDDAQDEKDEPVLDPDFRTIVSPAMEELVEALDARWMTSAFITRVKGSVAAWNDESTSPASVLDLRRFFTETIDADLVAQAFAGTAASHLAIPYHLEHLRVSVAEFIADHPNYDVNCFIMMRFRESALQESLYEAVREGLRAAGLVGVRADEKDYTGELWSNLCVHMLGCSCGVAIFEQVEELSTSPNVALEVGFMLASGKRVLVLKDKQMPSLPSDLIGRLHKAFESGNASETVSQQIRAWAEDMGVSS